MTHTWHLGRTRVSKPWYRWKHQIAVFLFVNSVLAIGGNDLYSLGMPLECYLSILEFELIVARRKNSSSRTKRGVPKAIQVKYHIFHVNQSLGSYKRICTADVMWSNTDMYHMYSADNILELRILELQILFWKFQKFGLRVMVGLMSHSLWLIGLVRIYR